MNLCEMETLSQDSILECQICFNYYSPRRRPKLLDCRHTCCSVCLTQMRSSQKEIRCPWCRGVTKLPPGLSVSQLPDDPDIITVIAIPHASEHTPVFIRLPSNGCYMLPLPVAKERALGLPSSSPWAWRWAWRASGWVWRAARARGGWPGRWAARGRDPRGPASAR